MTPTSYDDPRCLICGVQHEGDCDPKRLKKIDDSRKAHEDFAGPRQKSEGTRLADGFDLLEDDDVVYPDEEQ